LVYSFMLILYHNSIKSFKTLYGILANKRWNNLSKKKEEYIFVWNQKLIAAIFAIAVVNLIPTITMYYVWFLLIQIVILLVKILLDAVLKLINNFPLFLLLNYIFNSTSFPSGVQCKVFRKKTKDNAKRTRNQMEFNFFFSKMRKSRSKPFFPHLEQSF